MSERVSLCRVHPVNRVTVLSHSEIDICHPVKVPQIDEHGPDLADACFGPVANVLQKDNHLQVDELSDRRVDPVGTMAKTKQTKIFDIAVVGGGPSGRIAALRFAKSGF